jgi:hypothetical protein
MLGTCKLLLCRVSLLLWNVVKCDESQLIKYAIH